HQAFWFLMAPWALRPPTTSARKPAEVDGTGERSIASAIAFGGADRRAVDRWRASGHRLLVTECLHEWAATHPVRRFVDVARSELPGFCLVGLLSRLRGAKKDYRSHCRGDAPGKIDAGCPRTDQNPIINLVDALKASRRRLRARSRPGNRPR